MTRIHVDGTDLSLVETGAGWLVVDGDQLVAGPFRTKGEALSAAIATEAVAL